MESNNPDLMFQSADFKSLNRSLNEILKGNKENAIGTHVNRSERLRMAVRELRSEGYRLRNVRNMKSKHVHALVNRWRSRGLAIGTIKNRMSDLRWLSRKIDNPRIVERSNRSYDIEDRKYVRNDMNIAKRLDNASLSRISNDHVRMSLRLQESFGLRREEAMKIQPNIADKGDRLELKDTWCKGGRARSIPIRTEEQRALLNEVKQFVREQGDKSLIPRDLTYSQQLKAYEYQTAKAGVTNNHGLRHQYAQDRYLELTGRECPKNGGLTNKELTKEQRAIDYAAREVISAELGHGREEVTAVYLGR